MLVAFLHKVHDALACALLIDPSVTEMIVRRSSRWTWTKRIMMASPASITVIRGACADRSATITSASEVVRAWRHFAQHVGQSARWFSASSADASGNSSGASK